MKNFLRRSVGIMIIIIMILCISICANASTKSLSLYYTGTNVGSHNTESFNLPAASVYTIKEYSHSGSFQSLSVTLNGVFIGNLTPQAMMYSGYPIDYNTSAGSAHFDIYIVHGSGSAGFSGAVIY